MTPACFKSDSISGKQSLETVVSKKKAQYAQAGREAVYVRDDIL